MGTGSGIAAGGISEGSHAGGQVYFGDNPQAGIFAISRPAENCSVVVVDFLCGGTGVFHNLLCAEWSPIGDQPPHNRRYRQGEDEQEAASQPASQGRISMVLIWLLLI